jgi:SnoaL-like domain
MQVPSTLGAEFARAVASKDASRMLELMQPDIDFRGLTPGKTWEAGDRDAVVAVYLGQWFEETDKIEAVEGLESDSFADRQRVGYRFSVRCPDGHFLVEQQAYLSEHDGRIDWMRVVCSGYRPVAPPG